MSFEMLEVSCKNCGAPMKYVPGSRHIKCESCDTEYLLQSENMFQQVIYRGVPLYNAYIPDGWNYNVLEDINGVSRDAVISYPLNVYSNVGNIFFFPIAYYKDSNIQGHHVDGMSLINFYKYLPIDQYSVRRIGEIFRGAQNIQLLEKVEDKSLEEQAQGFMFVASNVIQDITCDAAKYRFSMTFNGQNMQGYFSTILCHQKMEQQPQQQQGGGFFGMLKNIGQSMMAMAGGHNWGRSFDMVFVTPHEDLSAFDVLYDDFAANITYGPGYNMLVSEEIAKVQDIQMQGAMQRQQQQFAAQNQLSQSIAQRNNIIMSGWENRQAAQSRMMNNYSEGLRGVNSYTDMYGRKVEASVRYDHVYQDGSTYVASDQNLNFGKVPGNWTELKRNS